MTQTNDSTSQPQQISKATRMVIGGVIGLVLISLFLYSAGPGDPAWGTYWMIKPLIIVPFAGAMGGLCNYLLIHYRALIGVNKTVAMIVSVLVCIVGLWLGIVLGLNGTWWD